nr:hypothetical protein [Pseudomonas viridiflava]
MSLNTVKPDQKTEEPDEASATLVEWRGDAAVSPIFDPEVKVRAIVEGGNVSAIGPDIYLNFQVLVLLPKFKHLIGQVDGDALDLRPHLLIGSLPIKVIQFDSCNPE